MLMNIQVLFWVLRCTVCVTLGFLSVCMCVNRIMKFKVNRLLRTERPPWREDFCLLTCRLTVYPQLVQKAKQPEWSSWEQPSKFLENEFQLQLRYTKWNEAFTVYQSSCNVCSTMQYLIPMEVFPRLKHGCFWSNLWAWATVWTPDHQPSNGHHNSSYRSIIQLNV